MSIYIKGMEMPTSCMNCPFKGFDRAGGRGNVCVINDSIALHAVLDGVDVKFVRMGDCPLIPVPPHGRLIEAEPIMKYIADGLNSGEFGYDQIKVLSEIQYAPTIIEAEE